MNGDRWLRAIIQDRRLGTVDARVAETILRYGTDQSRTAFPSARTIAKEIGHGDPSNVRKSTRRLEKLGYLTKRTRTRPNGSQMSSRLIPRIPPPGSQIDPPFSKGDPLRVGSPNQGASVAPTHEVTDGECRWCKRRTKVRLGFCKGCYTTAETDGILWKYRAESP